ncbi:MAG: hypothetical protein KC643_12700 [Nitrospira sp.]|nr:hypothetical protein [Nitrospira sp.]
MWDKDSLKEKASIYAPVFVCAAAAFSMVAVIAIESQKELPTSEGNGNDPKNNMENVKISKPFSQLP